MKAKFLIITLFFLATIIFITWMWGALEKRTLEVNQEWSEYSKRVVMESQALSKIVDGFGYGGFIHDFKNYILRRDDKYRNLAHNSIKRTYEGIDEYIALDLNERNEKQIMSFQRTAEIYFEQLKIAEQLIKKDSSTSMIDDLVKVDDRLAIKALNDLFSASQKHSDKINDFSKVKINEIAQIYRYGFIYIIGVVIFIGLILLYIVYLINRRSEENQILLKLAPDAIIVSNHLGEIININNKAIELFKIPLTQRGTLSIEDLLPDSLRETHKKYREEFLRSDREVAMDDRGKHFLARKLNGEIIPVDISISAYETGRQKKSIAIIRDISEIQRLEEEVHTDSLTNILNRKGCEEAFDKALSRSYRYSTPLCLLMLDIDYFKKVNDQYGHQKGDEVLSKLSQILVSNVRDSDVVCRWGGEEFLIITPEINLQEAKSLAEKIRLKVEGSFLNDSPSITASLGVAQLVEKDPENAKTNLIERTDKALYESKNNGRNQVTSG